MIFIVDWGHKTENTIGPLSSAHIHLDAPTEFVTLVCVKTWFRAFFIPTIPTEVHYYLISEKDGLRHEISKADFEKYKPMAELNKLAASNKISEKDYDKKWAALNFD